MSISVMPSMLIRYAYDTLLLIANKNKSTLSSDFTIDLKNPQSWYYANCMQLNSEKKYS